MLGNRTKLVERDLTGRTSTGQVERIAGSGAKGRTAYIGLAAKCIDLSAGTSESNRPIQVYTCNSTMAQRWSFIPVPSQNNANLGTLSGYDDWCVQPAATTAGSAVRLQRCDGATGTINYARFGEPDRITESSTIPGS
ncbi:RICIN domain-containing protein [Micromonospora sp. LOL_024]|uniref:RICIN domain-containing protein n=1 Tax=Micromonospora sp. LOL_024 TaxID=3345412 RepID=UPI003A8746D2